MSQRLLTDARQRPPKALAEAIWNALDVGADEVNIIFEYNSLEAIKTILVTDDSQGMNAQQASIGFAEYGDSWKRRIDARTHNDRSIHGQRGQGRYDILDLRSWAEVLSEAEHRHRYVERALDTISNEDTGLAYLNRVHQNVLPDSARRDSELVI